MALKRPNPKMLEELIANSTEIDFQGYKVSVLNLETILELKRDSKDPRDRQRLPIYEETLKLLRDKDKTLMNS
jgi:hypothetical protein